MAIGGGAKAGDVFLEGHYRNAPGFGREMAARVNPAATRAGQDASRHFGQRFAAGLKTTGKVVGVGLAAGLVVAARGIVKATEGYQEHQKVVKQTAAAIKSTGGAANLSVKQVNRLSDALERKTTIDGDVIQRGANMLLTFTNIRNEVGRGNDIFTQATKTVLDMSVALGQDTKNSAIQLGKALNDPVKGVTALQRVGVTFTEKQRDQIKTLVESGRTLDAQRLILAELNREFGGSAAAAATPLGRLQVLVRQVSDAVGAVFLPALDTLTIGLLRKFGPAISEFSDRQGPKAARWLNELAKRFIGAVPPADQISTRLSEITTRASRMGERLQEDGGKVAAWAREFRPELEQVGPALRDATRSGGAFADTMAIAGPVLDVVARNIHNIVPWLPVLLAGFLAFRTVRTVIGPVREVGQVIANFTSPALAAATFLNARAQKALAAALREQTAATLGATAAQQRLIAATAASGTAAQTAAGRWALLRGALLGVLAPLAAFGLALEATSRIQERATGQHERGIATFLRTTGVLSPLADLIPKYARATDQATNAAQRHTTAVLAERSAVTSLKDALAGEKTAALDVRQAKLNVATAQQRLTQLVKDGRKGSLDYKQAQLDLKRAQLDLRARTDEYKTAQQRAAAATGGAMRASQQATPKYRTFGETAQTAGRRAFLMGQQAREGIQLIPSKRVTVTATFGFRTPPGISMHSIVGAAGGYVTPWAILPRRLHRGGMLDGPGSETSDSIPARLSRGEYVVNAKAVRAVGRDTMDWINAQGFAAGGPVLDARIPSASRLLRVIDQFEGVIDRSIRRLADRFDRLAGVAPPHAAGGWQMALRYLSSLGIPYSVISTFRPGARTRASGSVSYHALNRAADLVGPNMLAIWSALTRTNPTELLYSRAPYYISRRGRRPIGALDPITRADHYRHVHVAYDRGGWLQPGTTVAVNNTGRAEPIGFDYDRLAKAIAANPPVVELDGQRLSPLIRKQLRSLGYRDGVRAGV